ncbi:MAG: branched-chain amino acid ABC transporter permease [Clostridia bacterium]|nr:branched-chain amino acid ABC transporter permease [Clostridia bacterium]
MTTLERLEKGLLCNKSQLQREAAPRSPLKGALKNPLGQYALFGIILVVLQLISSLGSEFGIRIIPVSFMTALGSTLIYSMVSMGFCLLLGYSGLASLGTAGFIGIGSYCAFFCFQEWGLPYIVAIGMTLAISIIIGVFVGFISLRIEGIYLAIITLGLSEILRYALQTIRATVNIDLSNITLFGTRIDKEVVFYLIVAVLLLLIWITNNLIKSPTGRAMLAMKNSTSAAQAYGISLMKYRLLAFVLSTVYAALAGIMYMMYLRSVSTSMSTLFRLTTSLNILGAVIIGGAKSIWGVLAGTFIVFGLDSMFLQSIPLFNDNPTLITLFTGILIILVVMFYPGGLQQLFTMLKGKISAAIGKRREAKYGKGI